MPSKHHDDISPIVREWFPDASLEEQRAATAEIDLFLGALLRGFEAWAAEQMAVDSPRPENPDIL